MSNERKIVLVTGAANGIGKAVTIALASQGCTVLMLDKKSRHLEKLYDDISQRGYTVAQSVYDDFGHLDGLLHNAAELGSPSPMDQYDMQYWNAVMQVNLQAPYLLTRALLPLLKQNYQTNIIFGSAEVGRTIAPYWGAYSIAYAGLEAQMLLWAEELETISNIKVNSLDPGAVRTGFRRRSHPGESQENLVTPQEVVPAYTELLMNKHNFHAQQLSVDRLLPNLRT